jgi:hypothetical protein
MSTPNTYFNPSNSFNTSSGVGYTFRGGTSGTTATTTKSGSAVGNYFKSDIGKQTISQGIGAALNFGLALFGSNQARQDMKAQANIIARQGQDALSVEQERTRQALIQLEGAKLQGAGAGGNTALYIGLGVAGVVILGVVIFAVTRRSNS